MKDVTAARRSGPRASSAAAVARSGPTSTAVVMRSCASSSRRDSSSDPTTARSRSLRYTTSPTTRRWSAVIAPCRIPASPSWASDAQQAASSASAIWCARSDSSTPTCSETSSASPRASIAAAMTGATAAPRRSASRVTKAWCSICWRRVTATPGPSDRYQSHRHSFTTSWLSHASRLWMSTSSSVPSAVVARARMRPSTGSMVWGSASRPMARSARRTSCSGGAPLGEPTTRWVSAAAPQPSDRAPSTYPGATRPSATPESAPSPTSHRPVWRSGRAR